MRKLIAAINMTLDGYCDHTAVNADDELHDHYTALLRSAGAILYGRITYQLMEFWPTLLKNPSGNKSLDEFAVVMDRVPKIVFSHTLKNLDWESAHVAKTGLQEEVEALKQQPGRDIFVGSPSLIVQGTNLNLIDEYQICIYPVLTGKGLPLFKDLHDRGELKLLKTKTLSGTGAVVMYYERVRE